VKMLRKILAVLAVLVVVIVGGFAAWVASRQNLRFDDTPLPALAASSDSAVIARGRYLVRDAAPCAACHGDPKQKDAYLAGADVPLSGGYEWAIPPGSIFAANITSDPATGIGAVDDGHVARALRHGVGRDGRALLPFMEMQGLSDEDIVAVISYLRTQPPVVHPVPAHRFTVLGNVVKATFLANPVGPRTPPPAVSPRGATVENGRYQAASVAKCQACHTDRNPANGQFTNAEFSGSTTFHDDAVPGRTWSPPNLTPHPTTGVTARLDEEQFVARFRAGRVVPGSPMPWQAYSRMAEEDLRAIYRFLRTLPPVEHDTGPAMRDAPQKG
jgi:mono/diheme cytochrome c family protein